MTNKRRERFLKIAESRANKVIKTIQLLANCSNKSSYEYKDEEIKLIFRVIEREVKKAKDRFKNSNKNQFTFSLKK